MHNLELLIYPVKMPGKKTCTNLHSHQQHRNVSFSTSHWQQMLPWFKMLATGWMKYSIFLLLFVFIWLTDWRFSHVYVCTLCVCSFENCQVLSFVHYSFRGYEGMGLPGRKETGRDGVQGHQILTLLFCPLYTCGLGETSLAAGGPDMYKHLLKCRPSAHRHM